MVRGGSNTGFISLVYPTQKDPFNAVFIFFFLFKILGNILKIGLSKDKFKGQTGLECIFF